MFLFDKLGDYKQNHMNSKDRDEKTRKFCGSAKKELRLGIPYNFVHDFALLMLMTFDRFDNDMAKISYAYCSV